MPYELAALAVSLISVVIATVSLVRTRRLDKITKDLRQKQLELIERDEKERNSAWVTAEVVDGVLLRIKNSGPSVARDVNFSFDDPEVKGSIYPEDIDKLPAPILQRMQSLDLCFGYPEHLVSFSGALEWKNPDGTEKRQEMHLYV